MLNKHVVYYGVGSWRRLQRNTFFWFPNTKYLEIQFMYICLWVCPRMCAIFFTLRKLPSQQHFIGDFSLGTCQFLWHSKCLLLDNWNVFISVFSMRFFDSGFLWIFLVAWPCYKLWHHKPHVWTDDCKNKNNNKIQLNQISSTVSSVAFKIENKNPDILSPMDGVHVRRVLFVVVENPVRRYEFY